MLSKKLTAILVIATATAFAGLSVPARAAEGTQDDFMLFFKMEMMDKNKDGMVSKAEFLAMVGKLWDMHTLEINIKGSKMTPEQLRELEKKLGRSIGAPSGG